MGEEFKNTKFGFLNWLGIAWAFYWRTYLLTVVFAILFLVLLKYIFFLLSAFLPSNPTLPILFEVLKWLLAGLACYFASSITVRWIITLKRRMFLLQLTDKAGEEVPVLEAKRSIWFKLGWSFFWRQLILTVLLAMVVLGIFILFNYLSASLPFGLKTVIRFVLEMLIIFIAVLSVLINIKWFLKAKYKNYDIRLVERNYTSVAKRNIGLLCLVIFSLIYAYSMTLSPWKKFLLPIRVNQQFANVQPVVEHTTSSNHQPDNAEKVFITKFFNYLNSKSALLLKLKVLQKEYESKNYEDNDVKKKIILILAKLDDLDRNIISLQVPDSLREVKKLKNEYDIAIKRYMPILRELSLTNLNKTYKDIKEKMDAIPVSPRIYEIKMLDIIFREKKSIAISVMRNPQRNKKSSQFENK